MGIAARPIGLMNLEIFGSRTAAGLPSAPSHYALEGSGSQEIQSTDFACYSYRYFLAASSARAIW